MFSRFWSRVWRRWHSRKRAWRRAHHVGGRETAALRPAPRSVGKVSCPATAIQVDLPTQCILCDKRCAFTAPRCKHGESFRVWLLSAAPANGARND
jgi:hypothetical protein